VNNWGGATVLIGALAVAWAMGPWGLLVIAALVAILMLS